MLALDVMDPTVRGVLFLAAFIVFAVEAVYHRSLTAAGLALFTIPWWWDAFAAS